MLQSITEELINLNEDKVLKLVDYALRQNATQSQIIDAVQSGLDQIGRYFEKGKYGVTDLMMAGIIFEEILDMNSFKMNKQSEKEPIGTLLLCTIKTDLHDIGKTIFKSMAVMAGLNVIDIGVDIGPQEIINQTKIIQPDVIGISSILMEGVKYIKETNDLLIENGIRNHIKIIVGGLAANDDLVTYTGVDAFSKDAFEGAQLCKQWIMQGRD